MRHKLFAVVAATFALSACVNTTDNAAASVKSNSAKPKNIIMIVADGMGPAFTTAYRNFRDDPATPVVEPVIFDDIFVGNASTYPAQVSGYVTDSAASATALAAGIKSYNGAIGVDVNKQPVTSVLQRAKQLGLKTGIAVTSQIVHATPAAYMAHNESRQNYNALADSYFDDRIDGNFVANVMLGGGTKFFERTDRNVTAQFIEAGYTYVDTYDKLATVPAGENVLGLFAPVGLPWVLDDSRKNRLAYLTKHAIKHLENDNGFFLLVEASQVDWAGHSNDIAAAMGEMHDLNLTLELLYDYVQSHPDTLVVLTADHSTGGLTIGANGDYRWDPKWLQNLQQSPAEIAKALSDADDPVSMVSTAFGFDLTDEEAAQVIALAQLASLKDKLQGIQTLLDVRSNTGWTTSGHTGVDVEVFAFGAASNHFLGQYDNTYIAKKLFNLLPAESKTASQ
ncbi:alkaline phosphatase [Alteromonas sp. chi3]|uniref:Alkaline phosphatase n=1 Tax=Alteromonas gilva TaxID=2987522 RepID=A0ABT5L007_9ALTE|nr:alkaline phosphatase [Alteromonas gilva]MDC8830359.1 alkaline phosphatase [Alteromonas gilva]